MSKCILFIDGENFLHKVEEVLKEEGYLVREAPKKKYVPRSSKKQSKKKSK